MYIFVVHDHEERINGFFERICGDVLEVLFSLSPALVVGGEKDLDDRVELEVHRYLSIIDWRVIHLH